MYLTVTLECSSEVQLCIRLHMQLDAMAEYIVYFKYNETGIFCCISSFHNILTVNT